MYSIESERIVYRQITQDDTDLILKWRNSDFVKKYHIYQKDISREEHLNYYHNQCETGNIIQFIMSTKNDNIPFGCVFLKNVKDSNSKAEYGIFIGYEEMMSNGLGSEACKRITEFAFEELNLHKVYLRVFENNERAIKSYKNAGYEIEGTFKDDEKINGEYVSVIFMGKINPKDWVNK